MSPARLATRKPRACLVLLVAALAVSVPASILAQTDACPDITLSNAPTAADLKKAVIQACKTDSTFAASPAACGPCQCALVAAVAPLLRDSGAILPTEMYTASAVLSITQTLKTCSREFALQLLEADSDLKLSQLLSLDACVADEKLTTQCMSQPGKTAAAASGANVTAASGAGNATMRSGSFGDASDGSNTLNEIIRDASCALAAAGNSTESADDCAASVPATSSWIIMAPINTDTSSQGLKISSKTTRGPIAWRAGCWCDESYDPVCDPVTRKQYPNACSAKCQFVSQTVPCSSLPPLITRSQYPGPRGSTVYVYDESMVNPTAAAFEGPVPPAAPLEADEDTQLFYYYYDDDVDDTQEALDITTGFYKAMMAANYGDDSSNAALIANSVTAALKGAAQAAAAAPANAVQGQDGSSDNSTAAAPAAASVTRGLGVLDQLRNMTRPIEVIARLQESTPNSGGLLRNAAVAAVANATAAARNATAAARIATAGAAERRDTVSLNVADQPAMPSWLSTNEPGQTAAVYTRNPQRTSRILAALQAAAKQAGDEQQAAQVVVQLGPGLQGVIDGVQEAVEAQAEAPAPQLTGGLFREALNTTDTLLNSTNTFRVGNGTLLQALNSTVANATAALANGSTVRPFDITAFGDMLERLDNVTGTVRDLLPGAAASNSSSSGNGTVTFREANMSNSTGANSTGNSPEVKATSGAKQSKQKMGRRLLAL